MGRTPRKPSESGVYHLYSRGSGRQIIFEDSRDRWKFLKTLEVATKEAGAELFAYCLMGNHYHLVLKAVFDRLPELTHKLNRDYAVYFNGKYNRSGHLFQQRYGSQAIDDDAYFLEAIRYVHRNPVEAGMTQTCRYPWSSYGEYLGIGASNLVSTGTVLALLDGPGTFQEFHAHPGKRSFIDDKPTPMRVNQTDMLEVARQTLREVEPGDLKSMSKPDRDRSLRLLKDSGLTLSQITMLTGISRPTISRA